MASKTTKHYFNGNWVEEKDLLIPVRDLSVVRGFGVFDFLRSYNGVPFRLHDHVRRFYNSARLLDLEVPLEASELESIVAEGMRRNAPGDYAIRMTLTGGVSENFVTPTQPSLIVGFYPFHKPTDEEYAHGVKVITVPPARYLPEAKSLNYLSAVLAQREAKRQGAVEAIYVDSESGEIFEGTSTNVFAVLDGIVITPSEGVLRGITRQVVLELCSQLGIPSEERKLNINQIDSYTELFITSSTKEVLPVVQLDSYTIGDGKVGPSSKKLQKAFDELVERECRTI